MGMASSHRSPYGCTLVTSRCSAGSSSGSRGHGYTGPTTTEAGITFSGWHWPRACRRRAAGSRGRGGRGARPAGRRSYGDDDGELPAYIERERARQPRRSAGWRKSRAVEERGVDGWSALSLSRAASLRTLADLLGRGDAAPTAIRDPGRILLDHIADSLVALELPQVAPASSVVDIGAGPGLPGLPLAIALPRAAVMLVESKPASAFIDEAVVAAGWRTQRSSVSASKLGPRGRGRRSCDGAGRRPARGPRRICGSALRLGGVLVVWRGQRDSKRRRRGACGD